MLVNFLASMTGAHSEVDIQGSLTEIASNLATDFSNFREPRTSRELVDDFHKWTERHLLVQAGSDPTCWMVSPAMAENFQAIAEGYNRELAPAEVDRMKLAIRSASRSHSVAR